MLSFTKLLLLETPKHQYLCNVAAGKAAKAEQPKPTNQHPKPHLPGQQITPQTAMLLLVAMGIVAPQSSFLLSAGGRLQLALFAASSSSPFQQCMTDLGLLVRTFPCVKYWYPKAIIAALPSLLLLLLLQDATKLLALCQELEVQRWALALAVLLVDMPTITPFAQDQPAMWGEFCQRLKSSPTFYFLHDIVDALAIGPGATDEEVLILSG